MSPQIVDHRTARRAALIAGFWLPLAIVLVAEIVVCTVGLTHTRGLIVHWGHPRQTGPWWTYAILVAAIGLPSIAIIGFFLARATRMAGMNAWIPAISLGVTVFHAIGIGIGAVVLNQSTLAPTVPLAGGAVLAVVAALITWRVLPREASMPSSVAPAATLPVKSGEVAVWTGRFTPPAGLLVVIATVIVALIVLNVTLDLTVGGRTLLWIAPGILLITFVTTSEFRIRASARGLSVRSVVGLPRFTVPASDIARAGVVSVDPMADFGGWGLRWVVGPSGKGRMGLIAHKGQALEVIRRDGRSIVITTDDAGTAAAVLETYATKAS